jgi:tRNA A-37 threonylcarbamoyl transferase component Bud32
MAETPTSSAEDPLVGSIVADRYRIEQLLAEGSLAASYRAEDGRLRRRVALKRFHAHDSSEREAVSRQLVAARAIARVSHEHIAVVLDEGVDVGVPFVVTEFVRGESFHDRIERFAPLDAREVGRTGVQTSRALAFAHGRNIVHGNLRPDKVLFDEGRNVKLVDFGSSNPISQLVGDPFAAPRWREPGAVDTFDAADDIYSLGAMLFAALTQRAPAPDVDAASIQLLRPDVSQRFAGAIAACLASDPALRPQSMREVADMLASCREAAGTPGRRDVVRQRRDAEQLSGDEWDEVTRGKATGGTPPSAEATSPAVRSSRSGRAGNETPRRIRGAQRRARILAWSMVVVPLVVLVLVGMMIAGERASDRVGREDTSLTGKVVPIPIAQVASFDPPPDGDGVEHPEEAANVNDQDASTFWESEGYDRPDFDGVKGGVGLVLTLATAADVREVRVYTNLSGWTAEVYAAQSPAPKLSGWEKVSKAYPISNGGIIPVKLSDPPARYLLVRATRLAIDIEEPERYRARISGINVRGVPAK